MNMEHDSKNYRVLEKTLKTTNTKTFISAKDHLKPCKGHPKTSKILKGNISISWKKKCFKKAIQKFPNNSKNLGK